MQNGAETKLFPLRFGRGDGTCKEPRSGDGIAIVAKAVKRVEEIFADRVSHDLSAGAEKRSWVQQRVNNAKRSGNKTVSAPFWSR